MKILHREIDGTSANSNIIFINYTIFTINKSTFYNLIKLSTFS
jgi:hypothetical protein